MYRSGPAPSFRIAYRLRQPVGMNIEPLVLSLSGCWCCPGRHVCSRQSCLAGKSRTASITIQSHCLQAAVGDSALNCRIPMRHILSVHIGNARHAQSLLFRNIRVEPKTWIQLFGWLQLPQIARSGHAVQRPLNRPGRSFRHPGQWHPTRRHWAD